MLIKSLSPATPRPLLRSSCRILFFIINFILLPLLTFQLFITEAVHFYKDDIIDLLNRDRAAVLSIDAIKFSLFTGFTLSDVRVTNTTVARPLNFIRAREIVLWPDIIESITRGRFVLKKIVIRQPQVNISPSFGRFVRSSLSGSASGTDRFFSDHFTVTLAGATFTLPANASFDGDLIFDGVLECANHNDIVVGGHFDLIGLKLPITHRLGLDEDLLRKGVDIDLTSSISDAGFKISSCSLTSAVITLFGGGTISADNGVPRFDIALSSSKLSDSDTRKFSSERVFQQGGFFSVRFLTGDATFHVDTFFNQTIADPSWPFRVNNFICSLECYGDRVEIKEARAFVNDFPLGLTGRIFRGDNFPVEFHIESHPNQFAALRENNPFDFVVDFKGNLVESGCYGDLSGKVFARVNDTTRRRSCLTFSADAFKLMRAVKREKIALYKPGMRTRARSLSLAYTPSVADGPEPSTVTLLIDEASLFIAAVTDKLLLEDCEFKLWEGVVYGDGSMRTGGDVPVVGMKLKCESVNLAYIQQAIPGSPPISGTLSGEMSFSSFTNDIHGSVNMYYGQFENLPLMESLSNFLGIPSLRVLPFQQVSSSFIINKGVVCLPDLSLEGDALRLGADLRVDKYGKINGELSAGLSKGLLQESKGFRFLLWALKYQPEFVDFRFRLAGFNSAPRIQWMHNDFKNSIGSLLPRRMKARMEADIEKAFGALE